MAKRKGDVRYDDITEVPIPSNCTCGMLMRNESELERHVSWGHYSVWGLDPAPESARDLAERIMRAGLLHLSDSRNFPSTEDVAEYVRRVLADADAVTTRPTT